MNKIDRSEYLNNELDKDTPYKITAPKQSKVPLRTNSKEKALSMFQDITEQGISAILTFNCPITKTCRILKTGPKTIYSLSEE